ncbi:hypothetical protein D3C79_766840 [compost metagenome]
MHVATDQQRYRLLRGVCAAGSSIIVPLAIDDYEDALTSLLCSIHRLLMPIRTLHRQILIMRCPNFKAGVNDLPNLYGSWPCKFHPGYPPAVPRQNLGPAQRLTASVLYSRISGGRFRVCSGYLPSLLRSQYPDRIRPASTRHLIVVFLCRHRLEIGHAPTAQGRAPVTDPAVACQCVYRPAKRTGHGHGRGVWARPQGRFDGRFNIPHRWGGHYPGVGTAVCRKAGNNKRP